MNPVPLFLIIVTLPLLLGGCGREEPVNLEELEERESIWYLKDSETPYTGESFRLFDNGQKRSEVNFTRGKLVGLFVKWHENGQKKAEGNWKDGKEIFEKIWNSKGELEGVNISNVETRGSISTGFIKYLIGSYTPYTGKTFSFHGNGQKLREVNYKNGKKDGLDVWWHKTGQKSSEANYKDGKEHGLYVSWHENGQKRSERNWKEGKKISEKWWNSKGKPVDTYEEAKAE